MHDEECECERCFTLSGGADFGMGRMYADFPLVSAMKSDSVRGDFKTVYKLRKGEERGDFQGLMMDGQGKYIALALGLAALAYFWFKGQK
jgi:hypothetical protein